MENTDTVSDLQRGDGLSGENNIYIYKYIVIFKGNTFLLYKPERRDNLLILCFPAGVAQSPAALQCSPPSLLLSRWRQFQRAHLSGPKRKKNTKLQDWLLGDGLYLFCIFPQLTVMVLSILVWFGSSMAWRPILEDFTLFCDLKMTSHHCYEIIST